MIGIDRKSGKVISDSDYLRDRIESCLSMRIGTHPMRRLKGSRIPELIDRPLNSATVFELQVAAIDALSGVENGFNDLLLLRVVVDRVVAGVVHLSIVFSVKGITSRLENLVISR